MQRPAQISSPVVDLCRQPDGPRDRQLLLGAHVTVLAEDSGWSYVQATRDGYCGYVKTTALGEASPPTHKIIAPASHAYTRADMKSPDRMRISFGAQITAISDSGKFVETSHGFIPRQHLSAIDQTETDPAAIAALFIGTPYLWGGNSRDGIDCSGLVQAACHACGIDCAGDSDMQADSLGKELPTGTEFRRNDLLFWKGHIALVTGPDTMIHANAFHMAVTVEPIKTAIARTENQGGGPTTTHRRLPELPIGKKSTL